MNRPIYYPLIEIDKAIGTSLHTNYNMPDGLEMHELENKLVMNKNVDYVREQYAKLVGLNPELSGIRAGGEADMWSVLMGATSGYPARDIKFFVEDCNSYGYMGVDVPYRDRVHKSLHHVEAIHKGYIGGYLPCEDSLKIIEDAINA